MTSSECGIWIDQRDARIVRLDGDGASVRTIRSEAEFVRPGGGAPGVTAKGRSRGVPGSRMSGPQVAVPDDRLERRRRADLDRFYHEVADQLDGVGVVYIAGPGEAPHAFARVLAGASSNPIRVAGVEAMGRMTEGEWLAHVRAVFGHEAPRVPTAAPGAPAMPGAPR